MDIFEEIKHEHEEIKAILSEMEKSKPSQAKTREKLVGKLKKQMIPHHKAEEKYFFKILFDETDEAVKIHEGIEEHRSIQNVLKDLEKVAPGEEKWEGIFKVLKEQVEHHIEEEEEEILSAAQQVIDGERAQNVYEKFEAIEDKEREKITV